MPGQYFDLVSTEVKANRSFIFKVSTVAALGGLLFGFDTAIISGAIPFISNYFKLNQFTLGWAVSSIIVGCCIGALISGLAADKFGRKFILVICALLFAASGLGSGMSTNLSLFIISRLIGGIGVGAAAIISPMYIAEMAPSAWRGKLVSLYQLAIVSGILMAYFSNYLLANTGVDNWRYMFISQTIPAVFFLGMLLLVPETPRWLIKNNQLHQARKILIKTLGQIESNKEIVKIQQSFLNTEKSRTYKFSKKHLPILYIGVFIAFFQQVTGINAVLYYAPIIFKQTGIGNSDSLLQTISIGIVNVVTTFIAIGFVDKVGRKRFLLTGSLLMAISLMAIATCFHFHYFKYYVVLVAMLLYVASFGCTLGAVTWVYLSEIFPNSIRALGMSIATLVLWLADFLIAYSFPLLLNNFGIPLTLLTYASFCLIAFWYIWVKVPETKGRTLEEIELLIIK